MLIKVTWPEYAFKGKNSEYRFVRFFPKNLIKYKFEEKKIIIVFIYLKNKNKKFNYYFENYDV